MGRLAGTPFPMSRSVPKRRQEEEDGHSPFCWGQRLRAVFLISAGF